MIGRSIFIAILMLVFTTYAAHAQTVQTTGADVGAAYAVLGALFAGFVLALLIVFFVSPKAFPRKEFMGAVWPLVKKHFWMFVGILLVQQILVNLPSIITGVVQVVYQLPEDEPISAMLNLLVTTIISIILQAGLIGIALKTLAGGVPRIADLFSKTRIFWRYLGTSILYGFIVFAGTVISLPLLGPGIIWYFITKRRSTSLLLPGVQWFLKFSLWPYFLVDQNAGVIQSLKMSARATSGYKPSLLVLSIYLAALNVLGIAAFIVGLFVTVPITLLTMAWVYRRLSTKHPASVQTAAV